MPEPQYLEGQRLPASYANFYIANERRADARVRLPADDTALARPGRVLPGPAHRADRLSRRRRRARRAALPHAASACGAGLVTVSRYCGAGRDFLPFTTLYRAALTADGDSTMGAISDFIRHHYRHFNGAALVDAADAYVRHLDAGGQMFMTLAGAMSTAELGLSLAEMIRGARSMRFAARVRTSRKTCSTSSPTTITCAYRTTAT